VGGRGRGTYFWGGPSLWESGKYHTVEADFSSDREKIKSQGLGEGKRMGDPRPVQPLTKEKKRAQLKINPAREGSRPIPQRARGGGRGGRTDWGEKKKGLTSELCFLWEKGNL